MILAPLTQPAEALFCKERGQDGWRLPHRKRFTGHMQRSQAPLSNNSRGGGEEEAALEDLEIGTANRKGMKSLTSLHTSKTCHI